MSNLAWLGRQPYSWPVNQTESVGNESASQALFVWVIRAAVDFKSGELLSEV